MPPIAKDVLGRIKQDFVHTDREAICVTETDPTGRGTVTFNLSSPCLRVRLPECPVKWLVVQKCADAAIIEFGGDGATHLHLVELKSRLTPREWKKAKEQFHGAYLNSVAIGAVLKLPAFSSVTLHLAYINDEPMSPQASTAPSTLKAGLGVRARQGLADWMGRRVDLGGLGAAVPLRLIQRDVTGDARAGLR